MTRTYALIGLKIKSTNLFDPFILITWYQKLDGPLIFLFELARACCLQASTRSLGLAWARADKRVFCLARSVSDAPNSVTKRKSSKKCDILEQKQEWKKSSGWVHFWIHLDWMEPYKRQINKWKLLNNSLRSNKFMLSNIQQIIYTWFDENKLALCCLRCFYCLDMQVLPRCIIALAKKTMIFRPDSPKS